MTYLPTLIVDAAQAQMLSTAERYEQTMQYQAALDIYDSLLDALPRVSFLWLYRANLLLALGEENKAESSLLKAVELDASNLQALQLLVQIYRKRSDFKSALDACDLILKLTPNAIEVLQETAELALNLQQYEKAHSSLKHRLNIEPTSAAAHTNLGMALHFLGQHEQAIDAHTKALHFNPQFLPAYQNRIYVYLHLGCLDEALTDCMDGLNIEPKHPEIRLTLSFIYLKKGLFKQGWGYFETRWMRSSERKAHIESYGCPQLTHASELKQGQSILLWPEQGDGDVIHFSRYVSRVATQTERVSLIVPHTLFRLFQGLKGISRLLQLGAPLPSSDYHCPLMSLPLAFETFSESAIPSEVPYLAAPTSLIQDWGDQLLHIPALKESTRPKVGLVWSGGNNFAYTTHRNIDFSQFAKLNLSEIDFFSLQKGGAAEADLPAQKAQYWTQDGQRDNLHILTEHITDFADTAALIHHLDLVISVDTAVTHLAGAMGKPVWLLSRFNGCWRWLIDREDSPWYPTMRIFNQKKLGDWDDVMDRVRGALIAWKTAQSSL